MSRGCTELCSAVLSGHSWLEGSPYGNKDEKSRLYASASAVLLILTVEQHGGSRRHHCDRCDWQVPVSLAISLCDWQEAQAVIRRTVPGVITQAEALLIMAAWQPVAGIDDGRAHRAWIMAV